MAIVVDVAQNSEDGLSAYRISSDIGQFAGSTGAGGMIAAAGLVGSAQLVGVGLAAPLLDPEHLDEYDDHE